MNDFKPDATSPQWLQFETYLEGELQQTYRKLASLGLPPAETEQARGKAAFINMLLSLKTTPIQIMGPAADMEY